MSLFDIAKIRGETIRFEFPGTEAPIIVWAEPPTQEILAVAMLEVGLDLNEKGDVVHKSTASPLAIAAADTALKDQLAQLCICGVDGLNGWPTESRIKTGSGLKKLNSTAIDLIPREVRVIVGEKLRTAMEVSPKEGEPSGPQPTGNT